MSEEFAHADLSGARFRKVQLTGARFRMVDLSGAVLRDVSLAGAAIDGSEIDGLRIDGVEIAPLVEAELTRRHPARSLRRASDPEQLRAAWDAIQQEWAAAVERAAALPAGSVDVSVEGEWSFARTLRHLVFATDAWLGAIEGRQRSFHPWGEPFSELTDFVAEPVTALGVDPAASPSYPEVLALRADRVGQVRDFLAGVSPQRLAEEVEGPLWEHGRRLSVLRCLWVILTEECEHLRFAERDLDAIAATTVTPP
ncbi:MAG TPA: DinB family protein [Mycobacteriales bacterium]|nr:DinB family protein [Mycobacteriales bacterium]